MSGVLWDLIFAYLAANLGPFFNKVFMFGERSCSQVLASANLCAKVTPKVTFVSQMVYQSTWKDAKKMQEIQAP